MPGRRIACLAGQGPAPADPSQAVVAVALLGLARPLVLGLRRWARVGYRTAVSDPR